MPGVKDAAAAVSPTVTEAGALPEAGVAFSQLMPPTVETVTEKGSVAPEEPDTPTLMVWVEGREPLTVWLNERDVGEAVSVPAAVSVNVTGTTVGVPLPDGVNVTEPV